MAFTLTKELTFDEHKCFTCGRWWALERGSIGRCPKCADDASDKRLADLGAANRTISSLRGVITKLREAAK
jgi:hypothetical protein